MIQSDYDSQKQIILPLLVTYGNRTFLYADFLLLMLAVPPAENNPSGNSKWIQQHP